MKDTRDTRSLSPPHTIELQLQHSSMRDRLFIMCTFISQTPVWSLGIRSLRVGMVIPRIVRTLYLLGRCPWSHAYPCMSSSHALPALRLPSFDLIYRVRLSVANNFRNFDNHTCQIKMKREKNMFSFFGGCVSDFFGDPLNTCFFLFFSCWICSTELEPTPPSSHDRVE